MTETGAYKYTPREASFGEVLKFLTSVRESDEVIIGFLPDYIRNYILYMKSMPNFINELFRLGEVYFVAMRLRAEYQIPDGVLIDFYGKCVKDFVFDYGELLSIPYIIKRSKAFIREDKHRYIELFKYRLMEALYVSHYGKYNLLSKIEHPAWLDSTFLSLTHHAINFFKACTRGIIIDNRDMYLSKVIGLPETGEVRHMKELVNIIDNMERKRKRNIAADVREALGTIDSFKIR